MHTLNELFQATYKRVGGKTAISFGGRNLTFPELDSISTYLARALAEMGIAPGDRVALRLPKCMEFIFCYLADLKLGAVTVPLNPAYPQDELAYFLSDSGARLLVTDSASRGLVEEMRASLPALQHVLYREEFGENLLERGTAYAGESVAAPVSPQDTALICYTSGTTGRPKGAMLSHANLASNIGSLMEAWGWTERDRFLHALPLYHMHGLGVGLHGALAAGCYMVMHDRFEPEAVMKTLERERMTLFMGVPTFYHRFLGLPANKKYDLASLRLFVSGSAPLREETFCGFRERFGHTILERYGMTETGMNISNPLHGERRPGTVGLPLPGVEARTADPETGDILPTGEVGEIQLLGPNIFRGYWQKPRETEESFTPDGWLHTGDLGVRDADGYYSIVGRSKDLIISGGLNVYPKEVERVIDEHPAVVESAVIGVPDPDLGEKVVACVVLFADARLNAEELISFCGERLAGYKKPKEVFFTDELPRNAMGKVLKEELKRNWGKPLL